MAHLRPIEPEEAEGLLAEEYAAAVERAGKVYNIVRSMSLSPEVLRRSMELYREIMFGPSGLSRQERELIATVVSANLEGRQVVAYFNYVNRVAEGVGTDAEPDWATRART